MDSISSTRLALSLRLQVQFHRIPQQPSSSRAQVKLCYRGLSLSGKPAGPSSEVWVFPWLGASLIGALRDRRKSAGEFVVDYAQLKAAVRELPLESSGPMY